MIKSEMKRWKIKQLIAVSQLKSGQSYSKFLSDLKFTTVRLPRSSRVQINRAAKARANESQLRNESAKRPFPGPHVPPLCAPVQVQTVQAATRKIASGQCVWWSLCNSDQKECRGTHRELCDNFWPQEIGKV